MQQSLVDDLLLIDDMHERLAAVVDRARRHPRLPPEARDPAHLVPGCVSQVWLLGELHDGRCVFRADADSPLVRGLVLFTTDFFSHSTPAEIFAADTDPLAALDLTRSLSPTRRNGLAAVTAAIRSFARSHLPSASPELPSANSDLRA